MDKVLALALVRSLLHRVRHDNGEVTHPFGGLVSRDEVEAIDVLVGEVAEFALGQSGTDPAVERHPDPEVEQAWDPPSEAPDNEPEAEQAWAPAPERADTDLLVERSWDSAPERSDTDPLAEQAWEAAPERSDTDLLVERAWEPAVARADTNPLVGLTGDPAPERGDAWPEAVEPPEAVTHTKTSAPRPPTAGQPPFELDRTALSRHEPENSSILLCLDFGTARSKAFAATSLDGEVGRLFDLPIGRLVGEDLVYSLPSSIWIDDEGFVFAGAEAVRRSLSRARDGEIRPRLDSFKQEIGLGSPGGGRPEQRLLGPELNPTAVPLTIEDAITFYLAYLTDLSTKSLASQHWGARYARRRFVLPCWDRDHRLSAASVLEECTKRAVLLADTFRGRWTEGVPAESLKRLLDDADQERDGLGYLIAAQGEPGYVGQHGGVLEPLAAGSTRIWKEDPRGLWRKLVLVIDVGAGTTDLSLFWVVQQLGKRLAFPVSPGATALRLAGDHLDSALLSQIEERAELGAGQGLRKRVRGALGLEKRRLKEQLFRMGEIQHRLVNDQVVRMTLQEFAESPGVREFTATLQETLGNFLAGVDASWFAPGGADGVLVAVTGGGCDLPMVKALADREWTMGGRDIRLTLAPRVPRVIEAEYGPEFRREYPQLAVALGGALPVVLDERDEQKRWAGAAPPSGAASKHP